MSKRLRIGIIGAGGIVKARHLPGLARLAEAEVTAVANRRIETAQAVANEWHIPHVESDWRDLIARDDVDAVLIATPPYLHKEASIAALEAGKHVFCQARMAMDYTEAQAMLAAARAAERKRLKAQVCLAPHCLNVDKVVRRLIHDERVLGELTTVNAMIASNDYLDPTRPLHWRQMWSRSGYNTLQLGMFVEVLHRWLGPFRTVTALSQTFVHHRPLGETGRLARVERPDTVAIAAELSSGALANLQFSGVVRRYQNFVELHGTRGSLRHVIDEDAVWVHRGQDWERIEVPTNERLEWTAEADFVHSALHDEPDRKSVV